MKKYIVLVIVIAMFTGCMTTTGGMQNTTAVQAVVFEDRYDGIVQFSDNAYDPELTAEALDVFFKSHTAIISIEYEVPGEVKTATNPYYNSTDSDSFVTTNSSNKLLIPALEKYKEWFAVDIDFRDGRGPRHFELPRFTLNGGEISPWGLDRIVDKGHGTNVSSNDFLGDYNSVDFFEFGSLKVGEIVLVNDPSISKYAFIYYIPESMGDLMKTVLWGNGSITEYDGLVDGRLIQMVFKTYYAEEYGYVALQVLTPAGAQYMADTTMIPHNIKNDFFERPDLEYVKVINAFMDKAKSEGYNVHEKVFMTGFSNAGIQSNVFPIMHPEMVEATAIGAAGIYLYPTAEDMNWPMGFANVDEIEDFDFDIEEYRNVEHLIFVGENDNKESDPVFNVYYKLNYGNNPVVRVPLYSDYLNSIGVDSEYIIYENTGHEWADGSLKNVFKFFNTIPVQ